MRIRLPLTVLLSAALVLAPIPLPWLSDPASAAVLPTWATAKCDTNSTRTDPFAGVRDCIANYETHTNRGRIATVITDGRATQTGAVYEKGFAGAEYIAQGRLIAKKWGVAVNPGIQWETSMPTNLKRLDLMRYDPASSTGVVEVLELKGTWFGGTDAALKQATTYREEIAATSGHNAALWHLDGGAYTDMFYRGDKCEPGQPGIVDGWRYTVSAPRLGVVLIGRSVERCSNEPETGSPRGWWRV